MKRWLLLAAMAGGALAAIAAPIALGAWNPMTEHYVQGVDVSAHQGRIDWDALARADVRFAYIKATEGASFVDPRFAANWAGAARAGVRRGAYLRYSPCRSPQSQAAIFIKTVPRAGDALPPAIDVEDMNACGDAAPNGAAGIGTLLDLLEARYGLRPVLYVTRQFHAAHERDFPRERFWVRSLYTPPDFRQGAWVIWQHHNGAHRPGVDAPIDLDAFRGDAAALARFAHMNEPAT